MICTQVPVVGSQRRMVLSHPELASLPPSGLHSTPYTLQRWPRNTLGGLALATSQIVTMLSAPPLASRAPSGLQATSTTQAAYPSSARTHRPRSTSHSRSVPSSLPL